MESCAVFQFYDSSGSILGNEELREPFLSLVLVLTEVDFSLNLQNCSFLDESWLLPVCVMYETVPCRALGMVVRYVDGRVIVIEVLPGSQAEVDEVVLAGDVLDEINGCSLRNAYSGQAGAMLQKLKGQPLSLRVLRWQGHNGEVYEPLLPYLEAVKKKEPHFQLQCGPRHCGRGEKRRVQGGRLLYNLRYLGRIGVGMVRRWAEMGVFFFLLSLFFHACASCCSSLEAKRCCRKPFLLCWRAAQHHGASSGSPKGSTFDCLVFASSSEQECEEIIQRIAAGFKHTEWFV
ncbi:uncharacterized protein LOC122168207 isoform X3 [Centrocercus urophasianus]|uniref:uncharacterized protein LOC122168207 isoform X3 n=1 Tax=Centrocercus urophasianus TaxID=9002 RepID=UPI001C64C1DB|nr:uncharacterized protein LOC122168207 isoform X3 [Centrocercus urophasianus]